ncbi:MAG: hypothetical protein JWN86_1101 [Planctomycetota bacterium]|nr:hypothetical protein [Planctomycetota bacterium]
MRSKRAFLPSSPDGFDRLEDRMVLSHAAALSHGVVALTADLHAKTAMVTVKSDLNSQVLAYAKRALGTKVGDGECATLADEAVRTAGGKRFYNLGPSGKDADYVWGRKVTTLTTSGGSISSIKAGDIIQFRNVSFSMQQKVTKRDGSYRTTTSTSSYGHHTAVVSGISGNFINLLQQNVGSQGKSADAKKIVQNGQIWGKSFSTTSTASDKTVTATTFTFKAGTMWVYRPYS